MSEFASPGPAPETGSNAASSNPAADASLPGSSASELIPVVSWDPADEVPFNWVNLALIGAGVAALAIGFVLLRQVNSDASNWQGTWSPLILLAGYALVAVGILVERDPELEDDALAPPRDRAVDPAEPR